MRRTRYAWLAGSVLAASCSLAGSGWAAGKFEFDAQAKTLLVTTSALELKVEGGAVVALKNRRTGETLSSGIPWSELEKASAGAVCAEPREAGKPARQPIARKPLASSPVAFQHVSKSEGVLTYTGLSNGPAEDELRIGLRLEEGGELSFRVELRLSDPRLVVREVCLPFVGLKPEAVILGSGERFARNDEPFSGRCMRVANNLYSPPLAVIEGKKGVIGMWPEAPSFGYDDMVVNHKPEADEVVPQVALAFDARDPETASEPGVTRSSWWRLAALPSWLDVAKRYRAYLEKKTAAKPLWQHDPAWVRDIHAVYMERPNTAERAKSDQFYADLAAKFDPKKLLLFYWNGNCILLFADHRYMTNFGYPKPQEIAALRRHGFRWIGYHPYVLLMSPKGKELHLAETRQRGFGVPDDYTFQPDYDGPPEVEKFYDFFRPVSVGYYASLDESKKLWTLHPGTKKARDYLARNFGNYCRTHEMSGAYLDILGADHAGQCLTNAPEDRRIMEGNDWRRGEELACRAMKQANPNLALMSEVQGEWTTTHTFYTWEGQSHLTHPRPVRLNHPLRAACWGSYTWTRFDPHTGAPEALALMAGLPPVNLADDWSIARAKLYMDEELFHDLPDKWDSDALAYFRAKGGRWFQYRRMPWGYAYVEQGFLGHKVRLGRLLKQGEFPLKPPGRIQGWIAYRDGKPIGLNPSRSYNFLSE
ncbi:MAG: hypothetical protein FJ279_22680, partial [Planctomycetes bacterium]|nr:hypothetical protein [Planctomycetota bacterium]